MNFPKTQKQLKVLIACEYSGIVREAFKAQGCYALSCDLLPTEIPGEHYQGNVLDILKDNWDLMIAHPPCQYLSYAANKYWNDEGRESKRNEAVKFFIELLFCDIHNICIENPSGYMNTILNFPNQFIHPYYFGDNDLKRTCLWLKNLPKLEFKTNPDLQDLFIKNHSIQKPDPVYIDSLGKKRYRTDAINGLNKKAAKERSRFFPKLAEQIAKQWINYLNRASKVTANQSVFPSEGFTC